MSDSRDPREKSNWFDLTEEYREQLLLGAILDELKEILKTVEQISLNTDNPYRTIE